MGASILWERNVVSALKFHPEVKAKWYAIDRKGKRGQVATFTSPAFFSFHTVNAFQEDGSDGSTVDIFCDTIQHPDDSIIHRLYYENIVSTGTNPAVGETGSPSLVRYKLPGIPKQGKGKGTPSAEVITTIPDAGELPTINPLYETRKQRYMYSVISRGYSSFFDGLGKVDLETKEITYWGKEPKPHTPGEAIFVPDGTNESEDAGYILSVVLDGEKGTSYLVCLDAKSMTEVASAQCNHAIGVGTHGVHYKG